MSRELVMDLFVGANVEPELRVNIAADGAAGEIIWIIDRRVEAGIDEEDSLGMLDNGDPDGKPGGEMSIENGVDE